ncbi:hypothetical protein [Pseudomonas sp. 273]|uniref:hypothetical protein n=1 Tax=Pseudomonas sp. 273 TaxID=75692 RepID=UPI0023D85457|nr:hypothetical protein [Pseudomonas sp. 273]
MNMENWRHKDEWKREGKGFCVVVSRHLSGITNENRWCVYLYIYQDHPSFQHFKPESDMFEQPSFVCHSYVSLFRVHRRDDGSIGSFQLGWDYSHDGDYRFSEYATPSEASEVFWDANRLFEEASE